ncbi:MAG: 1-acyl-sn-glycerol-3-phosphate acyltransferase [Bacteroidales bacterium]
MKKALAGFILKAAGWKITDNYPDYPRSICVMAPHTSMWDFVWGKLFFMYMGLKPYFLIKSEMFKWPLGPLLKAAGGIPVNRKNPAGLTGRLIADIKNKDRFLLVITPEGTRKKVDVWKTGVLRIAKRTGLPLIAGKVDYETKELGLLAIYENIPDDRNFINELKMKFAGVTGKHPERFNPYAKQ